MTPASIQSSIRTSEDELVSITKDLSAVVSEVCEQIKILKDERKETTGETKSAYNLVIANKVWILQQLIGTYWRETLNLELDKPDFAPDRSEEPKESFGAPTVETLVIRYGEHTDGPTGC
jgi:hypothetical protein